VAVHVARMGEMRSCIQFFGTKTGTAFESTWRRRRDNIEMYRKEMVWAGVDWILLAKDRD
jgi:hypothetical protein